LLAGNVSAASKAKSLEDLTGVWAHSEADCNVDLDGQIDRGETDLSTARSYNRIGICQDGVEMMYQAHHCEAAKVTKERGGLLISGKCRIKDYHLKSRFRIRVKGPDAISFSKRDFDEDYFWIDGDYVRCNRDYACQEE
jgi:hypothetical protein